MRAGGGGRMTPAAAGPVDLRWEERLSATVPAPHPRAGRGGWEAPSAPRRKEGEGRARRVVLARKRTRASATRSWGGCPGDAPPQGAAMPPKPPGAPPPQELGPEPYNGASGTTGPTRVPRPDRGAEPCAAPAGGEPGAWRGARAAGAAQPGGAGSRARGAPAAYSPSPPSSSSHEYQMPVWKFLNR